VVTATFAAGLAASETTSSLGAGRYDTSLTVTVYGERMPPEADQQCFTQTELEQLETWLATSLAEGCSVTNLKSSAAVTTFEIPCAGDGEQVVTRAELTTGTDSFEAVITTTEVLSGENFESIFAITARRAADCHAATEE
jgi:hypothetical protein